MVPFVGERALGGTTGGLRLRGTTELDLPRAVVHRVRPERGRETLRGGPTPVVLRRGVKRGSPCAPEVREAKPPGQLGPGGIAEC